MDSDRPRRTGPLSATGWLGVALAVSGAVLLFFGWWAASNELLVALQVPYLASTSIPGATMVIAGAVMLSGESARRSAADSARMIATLFDLLTVASAETNRAGTGVSSSADDDQPLLMVPGGNRYHRGGCILVDGKTGVTPVGAAAIRHNELQPCPVCNPAPTDL